MTARQTALLMATLAQGCRDQPEIPPPASSMPASVSTPADLVVASYNVFYGNASRSNEPPERWADAETLRVAASLDADILALQETNQAWGGALETTLAPELQHCRFHEPQRYLPGGLGVCARFPIVDDELIPSPIGWFPAQRVTIRHPRGLFQVLNVHLKPAVADAPQWWSVHHATRLDRKGELEGMMSRLAPGLPTLVLGDFNDLTEGDVFVMLDARGFENAFRVAPTQRVSWTWAAADPPLAALLDHVAYERDRFELVSARVVEGGKSDHQAIVTTLRW